MGVESESERFWLMTSHSVSSSTLFGPNVDCSKPSTFSYLYSIVGRERTGLQRKTEELTG